MFALTLEFRGGHRQVFFKENVRYLAIWTCRDPISLILRTRFSLILGTRLSILGSRIGSLKHLKKTLTSLKRRFLPKSAK